MENLDPSTLVNLILCIITLVAAIITVYSSLYISKVENTTKAYVDLQCNIIEKIKKEGYPHWINLPPTDPNSKLLTQYIHQLETFCACVNNNIYSYKVLKKISGKQLYHFINDVEKDLEFGISNQATYLNCKLLRDRLSK